MTITHLNIVCTYANNSLRIFDGESASSPLIGTEFCSTSIPPRIVSTGNSLHLLLQDTDEAYFVASYTVFESGNYIFKL